MGTRSGGTQTGPAGRGISGAVCWCAEWRQELCWHQVLSPETLSPALGSRRHCRLAVQSLGQSAAGQPGGLPALGSLSLAGLPSLRRGLPGDAAPAFAII